MMLMCMWSAARGKGQARLCKTIAIHFTLHTNTRRALQHQPQPTGRWRSRDSVGVLSGWCVPRVSDDIHEVTLELPLLLQDAALDLAEASQVLHLSHTGSK